MSIKIDNWFNNKNLISTKANPIMKMSSYKKIENKMMKYSQMKIFMINSIKNKKKI